jgi:osmotically-inducible protein OsmY
VTHVILGYGGVMGVGERQFIVPFSELTFSQSDEKLTVHTTLVPEEVQEMPEFRRQDEADDDAETAAENCVAGTTSEADKPVGESISDAAESAGAALGEATSETQRVASDTWITTKVKSLIYADSISQGFEVGVTILHDAVVLDGELDDQQSIDHVVDIAKSVEGVKSVDTSGLTIK